MATHIICLAVLFIGVLWMPPPVSSLSGKNPHLVSQVRQCKLVVTRRVTRCGFNSLTYGAVTPKWNSLRPMSALDCLDVYNNNRFFMDGRWFNITRGSPASVTFFSKGMVKNDGSCITEDFTRGNQRFENSFEETHVAVLTQTLCGQVQEEGGIYIPNFPQIGTFKDKDGGVKYLYHYQDPSEGMWLSFEECSKFFK